MFDDVLLEPDALTGADRLPRDAKLLPISAGALLVSRDRAVFCRIPAEEIGPVGDILVGKSGLEVLSGALRLELDRHGLFSVGGALEQARQPSVQIQLTNACNLGCAYCCTNSKRARTAEPGLSRMLGLAEEIREILGEGGAVGLLGGEPFLVPWGIDLAERLVDLGLELTVFTNGTRLGEDEVLALRTARLIGRGAEARVSLAGPTAESCDALSGGARFESALAGLDRLAGHGALAKVDLILAPAHVALVARELPRLRARLPRGTEVSLGILFTGGREDGSHVFGTRAELEDALDRIAFGAGVAVAAAPRSPRTRRRDGCSCALGDHLHVRSDGALFPCYRMEEQVGHLRDTTFTETFRRVRSRPRPASRLARCQECSLVTMCGGGCRSENAIVTGDPDEPACGPWRVQVLAELLSEDRPGALEWNAAHLLAEAQARGIEAPERLAYQGRSRHLVDA